MKSKTFQDVEVWRKAHAWVLQVYAFSSKFPAAERFGLTSQLRKAAVSVPANFAEGFIGQVLQHCPRLARRVPLLLDSRERPRLRRFHEPHGFTRRC